MRVFIHYVWCNITWKTGKRHKSKTCEWKTWGSKINDITKFLTCVMKYTCYCLDKRNSNKRAAPFTYKQLKFHVSARAREISDRKDSIWRYIDKIICFLKNILTFFLAKHILTKICRKARCAWYMISRNKYLVFQFDLTFHRNAPMCQMKICLKWMFLKPNRIFFSKSFQRSLSGFIKRFQRVLKNLNVSTLTLKQSSRLILLLLRYFSVVINSSNFSFVKHKQISSSLTIFPILLI